MPLILVVTALPPDFSTLSISNGKIKILIEVFFCFTVIMIKYFFHLWFEIVKGNIGHIMKESRGSMHEHAYGLNNHQNEVKYQKEKVEVRKF